MKKPLLLLMLIFALAWTGVAQEEEAGWEAGPAPRSEGLVLQPAAVAIRGRLHLVWSGTSEEARKPQVFHASIHDGENQFSEPRAPFFGEALGRVRRIGLGAARHILALIFQRQTVQSSDAYEVLISLSGDNGWSFSRPYVVDSFVHEKSGGTWVSIDGREGTNRPEFAVAWAAEGGTVRAASIDIKSTRRPRHQNLGTYGEDSDKIEVASLGRDGFSVVWSDGASLKTARLKPLAGKAEDAETMVTGKFGYFTATGRAFGPARVVAGQRSGEMVSLGYDGKWERRQSFQSDLPPGNLDARSDLDKDKVTHVAVFTGEPQGGKILYMNDKDDRWSNPELVMELAPNLQCTGFDIAATDDALWVVASQGPKVYVRKKKR